MKLKRILALILSVVLALSSMNFAVFAEGETTAVAKIGDVSYDTFGEAISAANSTNGTVEVEIYDAVEFTDGMELNGSYDSITFVGKGETAKITINQSAGGDYLEAHGKTVVFTDLILDKANPAWSGNSGHMGNYFSVQGGTATYNDCTFPNGACTSGGTATYNNCKFQNTAEYGLWVYDDALVTVNGGTIDSKKGIKVYSEDETTVTSTLTVKNATFTENVTAKPAVAIGYAESITLIGNTYNNTSGVLELDSGSDADCNGITFVAEDAEGNDITSTLTVVDRSNSNASCGVLVDRKIYTTVTAAAEAAQAGSTVTLLYSTDEEAVFAEGVVLDTNGHTAENVTVYEPVPTGSNSFAYTKEVDGYVRVWGEGGGNASESYELKLYSGGYHIATTTLNNIGGIIDGDVYVTWNFYYPESTDNYWTTVWHRAPASNYEPTHVELLIDGVVVATTEAKMSGPDNVNPVKWAELGGVFSGLEGEGTKTNPYLISNIEELVWFRDDVNAGNTYDDKHVLLTTDIDFEGYKEINISGNFESTFRPIGDKTSFNGTFDGGNHTISGLYISGWDLDYYWGSYGCAGLFGTVENATIKNLTVTDVEIQVEGGDVAAIAGHAIGNCIFENITVTDSKIATYNNGCAGIVAWTEAGNYNFKNITVAEDVVLAGLWGSFDSSIGGVVAQLDNNGTYNFEDVIVACRLDIYNDVTAAYKYYNYRMCGMLIGRSQKYLAGKTNEVDLSNVTCKNVKIIIGDWANYTYIWDDSLSYGCKRVEPGYTYGGVDVANYPDATVIMQSVTSIVGGGQYGYNGTSAEELVEQGFDSTEIEVTDLAYIARHEAELNGEYYATIEEALDKAVYGDTIILHMDINKDVTIGKSVTIDGGNFKYTGNINVSGTTSEVTVKNVNFENGTGYAITTNRIKSITVEDCTVNNYGFGFLYANKSTPTVVVKNVTVDGGNYGFHWVYGTSATLENVTMTNVTNGLLIQNYAGKTVTLKNCNLTNINIWERDGSSGVQTFKFEGNNTVSTLSTSQYAKYVLSAVDATLTAPEGLDVTADNVRYTVVYEDDAYRYEKVVKLGDDYYNSIQDAVDAANGNGTITLLKDVTEENITVDAPAAATLSAEGIVIDLDGHTLYGYIAPSTPTSLTVKNGNIVNTNYKYSAIEVNSGELTVENVNIESERHAVRIDGAVNATINGGVYRVLVNNQVTAHAVNVSGAATVTIKDGTFYGPKGTPNGSAMGGSAVNAQTGSTVIIEGGNFSGGVNNTLSAAGTLTVKGGVFDQDPTSYVADGYVATPNAANTLYMVTAERTLRLVPSTTEVKTGNTFTVDVYIDTADVKGVQWTLEYDTELFKCLKMDTDYNFEGTVTAPSFMPVRGTIDETKPVATYTFEKNTIAATESEFSFKEIGIATKEEVSEVVHVPCADVSLTMEIDLDYVVEVNLDRTGEYIAQKRLVLVYTNATGITFDFDGIQMYDVTGADYEYEGEGFTQTADTKVYALVVDAIDNGVFEDYEAKVSPDYLETATVITYDKNYEFLDVLYDNDVNQDQLVEWFDIMTVYMVSACEEDKMHYILKADVNGDKVVTLDDASSIINQLYSE